MSAGQRLRVELEFAGGGERQTIPYSAVIYGVEGGVVDVHERRASDVRPRADQGGVGPGRHRRAQRRAAAPGTEVVTVGGEELLGTEFAIEGE